MILVDTDVLIDIARRNPAATAWFDALPDDLALPGFSALELIQGCRNAAEVDAADELVTKFQIVWPDTPVLVRSYSLFKAVHPGNAIGIIDTLIALTAVSLDVPLHTFNQKHFSSVPNLQTIRPYVR